MGVQVSCGVHSQYRRKAMYQKLRQYLGKIFHDLARQKECRIEEGHLCADHGLFSDFGDPNLEIVAGTVKTDSTG